ncbi:MAG: hypothetical protein KDE33_01960 [Bacteroidetes bacterium]|nr:hypothetical protein [Bacteroidota bacterium]
MIQTQSHSRWQQKPATLQKENACLSKKAIHKICQTLNQLNCNSPDIISELKNFQFPISSSSKVNEALPKIFHELFNRNNGITTLSSDSISNALIKLAEIISSGRLNDVVITIGLGASEIMPSLRLPSYILPAIKVLKGISVSELNIGLPTVRVFKATHAGVYANEMNLEKTKFISEITLEFLSGFINKFYPELSGHFVFESDTPYRESPIYATIVNTALIIESLPGIEKELNILRMMGEKHGGKNGMSNSIFYAAAHPIYNQAIISKTERDSVTNFAAETPYPKLIIDFGGRPQKTFNSIIEALRSALSPTEFAFPPLINVIVKTGKVPVYYKAKHGDILLSDVCHSFDDFAIDPMTECDYNLLFEEVADYEYLEYINQFQQQNQIPTT